DDDYLKRYCLGADRLRERALNEYPPAKVSAITGLPAADIERLARAYGTVRPSLIRLNYGLQRHAGGGMAVRTITCLPAVVGAWRDAGGGALLSTSKLYPFNAAALERPDLIPPGTRTVNMVQLAEALNGELPGPPVIAPLGEAKCNTEVFRLLARRLGFEPELFEASDEQLAAEALRPGPSAAGHPSPRAFDGISLERLQREGPVRLNLPRDYAP